MATTIQSGRGSSPLLTADVASRAEVYGGRGLNFDGVTDYLSTSSNSPISGGNSFTMSAWINPDIDVPDTSNDYMTFIKQGSSSTDQMACFSIVRASSVNYLGYLTHGNDLYSNHVVPNNTWSHVVVTYSSGTYANGLKIYLNGQVHSSLTGRWSGSATSGTPNVASTVMEIGKQQDGNSAYFNGQISDVKIFDTALTEAQVQELYLKPENTPIAVQDNLSLWYPMCESSPESPQSIVYDHSEKGLGSELLADGDMEATGVTSWDEHDAGFDVPPDDLSKDTSIKNSGSQSLKIDMQTYPNSGVMAKITSLDTSKVYKFTGYVRADSSVVSANGVELAIDYDGDFAGDRDDSIATYKTSNSNITADTWTSFTYYFVPTSATAYFGAWVRSSGIVHLDDWSVKEVLMGNHATTEFYGSELFDADASTVDSGTHSWEAYASATMTNDSGAIKIVCNTSNGNGAYLKFADALDLTTDLTVGKTYRFTCSAKVNTGSVTLNMSDATGFSSVAVTETSFTTKTIDFVAGHATDTFVYAHEGQNETIWLDNFSLKEVGVSSTGFTTAQNEPTIPQIPLVKYNEKMLFDGVDNKVTISGGGVISGDATISLWVITNHSGEAYFLARDDNSTRSWYLAKNSSNYLLFKMQDGSGNNQFVAGSTALNDGKLHHLVASIDVGTSITIYVDGVQVAQETSSVPNSFNTSAEELYVGQFGSGSYFYKDYIDDISIFNTALSSTEVQELFNDGVALDATTHSKSGNLLGYWRNDGVTTWTDRSTNSNHGTVSGTPDSITIREGLNSGKDGLGFPIKNATSNVVRFGRNGSAEYLNIPDSDALDIKGDFTIELWYKQPDMGTGYQYIISRDDTTNRNWFVNSTNGNITLGIYSGGSLTVTSTSGTYDDDNWHHLCIVITSGTSIQIYIDTVLAKLNTTSIPTVFDNDPASLNIGNRSATTDDFIGSIDEVRLYNKALTAFEADGSAPEEGETAVSGEVVKNYKHGKGKHKND